MWRFSVLGLCLANWIAPLSAATLEQLSLNQLIHESTAIVRARVVDSYADFRGREIFTHWRLQVEDQWKGRPATEVMSPGGTAQGYRQSVPGAPHLVPGREYVLFLWTSKSGATYLTGWAQGVMELSEDNSGKLVATRKAAGESLVERGTWRPVKDGGFQMPYAELEARIAATSSKGAAR